MPRGAANASGDVLEVLMEKYHTPQNIKDPWPYRVSYLRGNFVWACIRTPKPSDQKDRSVKMADMGEWRLAKVASPRLLICGRMGYDCTWNTGSEEITSFMEEKLDIRPDCLFIRFMLYTWDTLNHSTAQWVKSGLQNWTTDYIVVKSQLVLKDNEIPDKLKPRLI